MEEDAEPNEDLAGNDFTYSQDTTAAFQELLKLIDSNTRELPSVLSPKHYAALTQLPLTYPWARLVLDLKELLPSFDRQDKGGHKGKGKGKGKDQKGWPNQIATI